MYDKCFRRADSECKNVNLCRLAPNNILIVNFRGRPLRCMFDSGADCSLVRESIADSLPGQRTSVMRCLRGIEPVSVFTSTLIRTTCEIDEIAVELEFYVVLNHEIPVNVLIGRDLLEIPGIEVTLSNSGTTVVSRARNHRVLRVANVKPEQIDTDIVSWDENEILRKLLTKYEHIFVEGYSKCRIITGELTIRLKNPDKFIQRRLYRMAPVEKEKLQKIIAELLENVIIRESKSPYASPVVLVKKKNEDDRLVTIES